MNGQGLRRLMAGTVAGGLLVAGIWGCSSAREAVDTAAEQVAEAAGEAVVRSYAPQFHGWYASYLTSLAFASGGYSVASATSEYEPGDSTVYHVKEEDGELTARLTRAKLFEDEEGNEAWKVEFEDVAAGDTILMEYLFSPNRERLLRLLARFPGDETGRMIPVEEDPYYREPRRLTEESLEGATVDTATVTVPAGEFEAEHVRYEAPLASGALSWWLSDGVPGGVVRYAIGTKVAAQGDRPDGTEELVGDRYVLELVAYGNGAKSELGIEP